MILQPALMFQDGMILQRDREIPVWGNAVSCESVTLTLQGKTYEARADAEGGLVI